MTSQEDSAHAASVDVATQTDMSMPQILPESSRLPTKYFSDNGAWKSAPMLTGKGCYTPRSDVHNIMITGGAGFIGSWAVRHFVDKYPDAYNIVCFDKLDYASSINNSRMLEGRKNHQFFHGDITNPKDVLECMQMYQIDTIMHFAAMSHVDRSFLAASRFAYNNVVGTSILLECAVKHGITRFVHVSTDEVYGEVHEHADGVLEDEALNPTNPYAASKAAAEAFVKAFMKGLDMPIVICRLNNVIGPHQYPEKLIPKSILRLKRGLPIVLHGDGSNTRHYLYGGDAVDAFDTILHLGKDGEIYNVDSRCEHSNLDVAKRILQLMPGKSEEKDLIYTRDRQFNDGRYAVDGSKLRALGWKQQVFFEEALAITVDWYLAHSDFWGEVTEDLSAHSGVQDVDLKAPRHVWEH